MKRVLLTGAGGKVGRYAVGAMSRRGFEVVATDTSLRGIPSGVRFERCDLTNANAVHRMMALVKPDVVVHCAAVVAPIAYAEPERAEAVNLGGTKHLIEAAKRHVPDAFFVFISSCAAFGPVCPEDRLRGARDPCHPQDNYGAQKLMAEGWLRESGLRQCSLRLGAVMTLENVIPAHPSYRPFLFMVSLDQPEHGVDVRDAARAIAASATKEPDGGLFLIAGDDSWKATARSLRREVLSALGLPRPPERTFRKPTDPTVPDGWFYECWMETSESEHVLGFQRTSRKAYMEELRYRHRKRKLALLPAGPALMAAMILSSPYVGRGRITRGATVWSDICRVYGLPEDLPVARNASCLDEGARARAR